MGPPHPNEPCSLEVKHEDLKQEPLAFCRAHRDRGIDATDHGLVKDHQIKGLADNPDTLELKEMGGTMKPSRFHWRMMRSRVVGSLSARIMPPNARRSA